MLAILVLVSFFCIESKALNRFPSLHNRRPCIARIFYIFYNGGNRLPPTNIETSPFKGYAMLVVTQPSVMYAMSGQCLVSFQNLLCKTFFVGCAKRNKHCALRNRWFFFLTKKKERKKISAEK